MIVYVFGESFNSSTVAYTVSTSMCNRVIVCATCTLLEMQ